MKRVRQPVSPAFGTLSALLLIYLLLPLAAILPRISSNAFAGWRHPDVLAAVAVSAGTATASALLLALFGIPLAYLLARRDFRGKTLVTLLVQLPLAIPPVVSGILLLMVFGPYTLLGGWLSTLGLPPLTDSLPAIVAAQVFVASPFLIIAARTAFEDIDPMLEQVATTFGKSPREIFFRITLPLAWPAILSGITLSWVRALGEFGATAMVAYHPYSLPVLAWVQFSESGLDNTVSLVLLMLVVGATGVVLSYLLARPRWFASTSIALPPVDLSFSLEPGLTAAAKANLQGPRFASQPEQRLTGVAPIAADIAQDFGDFRLDIKFETRCQRVAVLGPSGAGKSLLLKALAGLLQPAQGRLTVGGRTVFDATAGIWLRPDERRVGYVPQHFALFPHMTVWHNILFATKAETADADRTAQMVRLLGLDGLSGHFPHQLSFGQQQRVALARALVRQPDYLLLDEPFASLDAPLRLHLRRELLRILRQFNLPVVLVTHDPHEAYELVEEVIVIAAGRVLQQGRREDVFASPASSLVARLLGYRNTFRGQGMASTPDASLIEYQAVSLLALPGSLAPDTAVEFFVTPYGLIVSRSANARSFPTGTALSGVIDAVLPHSSGIRLTILVGNEIRPDYWEVEQPHGERPSEPWSEGDPVQIWVPQASVHVMAQVGDALHEIADEKPFTV